MTVVSLIPKQTVADEVRASVISILEMALDQARAGNISTVLIVALHPDGEWSDWQSSTAQVSEMIGRLEIAKQSRILSYLER